MPHKIYEGEFIHVMVGRFLPDFFQFKAVGVAIYCKQLNELKIHFLIN